MTHPSDDRDLREVFDRLRNAEQHALPAFSSLARRAPRKRESWRLHRPAAAALVTVVAVVIVATTATVRGVWRQVGQRQESDLDREFSGSLWRAPTDFLLLTPGHELLRTVPVIGRGWQWSTVPGEPPGTPDSNTNRTRRKES